LQIFCVGTFLAVTAQIIVAHYEETILSQIFVSLAGLVAMSLFAFAAHSLKSPVPAKVRA
jgi:hypothetical protein